MGEGEDGMICEDGIETCIISHMKQTNKKDRKEKIYLIYKSQEN